MEFGYLWVEMIFVYVVLEKNIRNVVGVNSKIVFLLVVLLNIYIILSYVKIGFIILCYIRIYKKKCFVLFVLMLKV